MTLLSIVIPAYNEEKGIAELACRVLSVAADLKNAGVDQLELLIVDDGSKDRTAEVASKIAGVNLICHPQNRIWRGTLDRLFESKRRTYWLFGCGWDVSTGIFSATLPRVEWCGSSDWIAHGRCRKQDAAYTAGGQLLFRQPADGIKSPKGDRQCQWYACLKREILEQIYPLPDGLNLTPVMSTRALHEGITIGEVPIPYSERVGRSKLSVIRDGRIFLQSMIWTVLYYNPVRILGMIGATGVGIASLVFLGIVIARLQGITTLGPWGVFALFLALISSVAGINIFALGVTFNYLVSLFYKKPIRQGLFGKPIFKAPLDLHFGWMGMVSVVLGLTIALVALALGVQGWEIGRLWFYLLSSALLFLAGIQLVIYWLLLRILEELSQRDLLTKHDMGLG